MSDATTLFESATLIDADPVDREGEAVLAALVGIPGGTAPTSRLVEWALTVSGNTGRSAPELRDLIGRRRAESSVRIVLRGLARLHDHAGRPVLEVGRVDRTTTYKPGPGWAPPHRGIFANA